MRWILLLVVAMAACTKANILEGGSSMKLTSNAFSEGSMIPVKYTCMGEDVNPQLSWFDVPEGTQSFALIVDDPDAPMGTWTHWLVKEIPADKRRIETNSVPGIEVINSFNKEAYGGPCPPSGTHRYYFKLYALDTVFLNVRTKEEFYAQVEKHKLDKAVLMGRFSKS